MISSTICWPATTAVKLDQEKVNLQTAQEEEERKYKYFDILAAILVTGGALLTGSVEVLTSEGQPWCSLPDLPSVRSRHTQG